MNIFSTIGRYFLFFKKVFSRPDNTSVFYKNVIQEIYNLGITSIGFVAFVSLFVGAVVTLQIAYNLEKIPLLPTYLIGLATRDSIILEFAPTMISLILAGKMGSNIASTIGTMRVTEQIDALEMMGINSSYLVLPKIVALVFINPVLIVFSMFLAILGGWFWRFNWIV